jgi:hypothetical protein
MVAVLNSIGDHFAHCHGDPVFCQPVKACVGEQLAKGGIDGSDAVVAGGQVKVR